MEPWDPEELEAYREVRGGLLKFAKFYRKHKLNFYLKWAQKMMNSLRAFANR